MIALEILKLQLTDFFERSNQQTVSKTIKKEEMYFNKSLLELENHLFVLKEQYKVNQNLNTGIISKSILNSFDISSTFFRSNDYALSFLVFLCMQAKNDAEDLHEMMDGYINIIKEKLSFHDIVNTETGATRCHTNLRFALNELRKYGLVYSTTTINNKYSRSLLPTPLGYLIALCVFEPKKLIITDLLPVSGNSSNVFAKPLFIALNFIKNSPEKFLTNLMDKYDGIRPLESVFNILINEYHNNILQFIEFNNDGFIVDEQGLKHAIETYYKSIMEKVKISLELRDVFLMLSNPLFIK